MLICTISFAIWGSSRVLGDEGWVQALAANTSYLAMYPLAILALLALLTRRFIICTLCLAACAFAAAPVASSLHPAKWMPGLVKERVPAGHSEAPYRILVLNIQDQAAAIAPLGALIEREQPDFAVLIECSPDIIPEVLTEPRIAASLPHSSSALARERWPLLTLSRFPMRQAKFTSGAEGYEWIFAYHRSQIVDTPSGPLLLSATHVTSPTSADTWRQGNRGLDLFTRCIRTDLSSLGIPILIGGDFNCTRSSFRYRWFRENSGLHAADNVGSITGTWPAGLPGLLRIGIDQAWASDEIEWVDRKVLEDVGSDHLPVIMGFRLQGTAPDSR